MTDEVHPANIFMFERIARIIGLDICGIDVMAMDLKTPVGENGGAILEVNAAPGFRMHIEPAEGLARNVAEPVVDMLFPRGSAGRIPIIAITGTNGNDYHRLTAHIAKSAKRGSVYYFRWCVYPEPADDAGDCTGPSLLLVLKDPTAISRLNVPGVESLNRVCFSEL